MDEAYFTVRWKRLLGTIFVVVALAAILFSVLQHQQAQLTDRLLTTARQLAEGVTPVAARVAYLDYLELNPEDSAARVELIEHVIRTEPAEAERDAFVVSQATKALYGPDRLPEVRLILVDAAMRLEWFSTVGQWLPTIQDLVDQYPRLAAFEGVCLFKKGDFHEAKARFKSALLKDPACATAWSGLIDLTELKSGIPAAIEVADEWISQTPHAESYLRKAQLLIQNGTPLEAVALYRNAVLPDVEDIEQVRQVANVFVHEFPPDVEVEPAVLERVYDLLAKSAVEPTYDDLVCLADLAHRSKDLDNAQKHYQQCLENRPGDLFATGRQVELFSRQGLNDQAHETLNGLTDSASQKVLKTTLRARLLAQESRHAEAVIALEAVVGLHADASVKQDAYGLLIESLWQQQRFSEAAVHAQKLLSSTPGAALARRFCAEALIRAAQYEEAIQCIHGFISEPEEQINAVWRMMDHAVETNQSLKLSEAIDSASLTNREATVPVLFNALKAVDSDETSQAIQSLKRAMIEQPGQSAFRIAVDAVEERAFRRMNAEQISDVSELKDSADQLIFLHDLLEQDQGEVGSQLKNLLVKFPERSDVVGVTSDLLSECAADPKTQRAILTEVYPELSRVIQEQGDTAVPQIARLLADCGYHDQAFRFLTDALQRGESVLPIEAFCHLMSVASAESPFSVLNVVEQLDHSDFSITDTARQILKAECDFDLGHVESAMNRLIPLVSGDKTSEAALFVILTHVDRLETMDLPMISPDSTLQKAAPENPSVLLACSRWNRRQDQYLKAATFARDAFLHDDRPEILIELAYIEWQANFTNRATQVLKLAQEMQVDIEDLEPLHKSMLGEMRADLRMPSLDFGQNHARSSSTAKSL